MGTAMPDECLLYQNTTKSNYMHNNQFLQLEPLARVSCRAPSPGFGNKLWRRQELFDMMMSIAISYTHHRRHIIEDLLLKLLFRMEDFRPYN